MSVKSTRTDGAAAIPSSESAGAAADLIKIAMLRTDRMLREAGLKAKLILQIHDELIIESHKDCIERAKDILKKEMENAVSLLVPLVADVGVGPNWFLAK